MSLQRGENIRGWEGVTRNLTTSQEERSAWTFSMASMILTFLVVGIAALFLSQSDIPVFAKALLSLGVLLFTLVLISGIYSAMVRRASGLPQDDDLAAGRKTAPAVEDDLVRDMPTLQSEKSLAAVAPESMHTQGAHQAAHTVSEPAPEPAPEPVPEPAPAMADAAPAPVPEPVAMADAPEDPGVRPESLAEARGGVPDDLTLIKGVGPKLAELCHSLGFYHFDQIASWTDSEVAWVDQNLEGFKGRVTRDEWVAQAKILAAGGQTEFSQRQ